MTEKEILTTIDKGQLQLSLLNKINHFWISILFGLMPLLVFLMSINGSIAFDNKSFMIIVIVSFFVSLFMFFIQNSKLKMKSIESNLSNYEIVKIIENIAIKLNWELVDKKSNYFFYVTNPKFTSGSWGEQIAILIRGNKVYVNSICDLKKRTSIVSMGRNHKNEQVVLQNLCSNKKSV